MKKGGVVRRKLQPVAGQIHIDTEALAPGTISLEFGGPEVNSSICGGGNDFAIGRNSERGDGRGVGFPCD